LLLLPLLAAAANFPTAEAQQRRKPYKPAPPPAAASPDIVRSDQFPGYAAQNPADVAAFWTPERMAAAKSMDLVSVPPSKGKLLAQKDPSARGPIRVGTAGGPGDKPRQMTLDAGALLNGSINTGGGKRDAGKENAGMGSPGFGGGFNRFGMVFTRYRLFPDTLAVRTTHPHRTIGRLFFTIPGVSGTFSCSASVINSNNLSTVWTAGHCVSSPPPTGPVFHTDFAFVPSYHSSTLGGAEAPLGVWPAAVAVTFGAWIFSGCLELDMGTLVIAPTGGGAFPAGTRISQATGYLGFITGLPALQSWKYIGYPAGLQGNGSPGPLFDGGHQELCSAQATVAGEVTCGGTGNFVIGGGCDQTGGTSGGPWVLDYTGTQDALRNLLNGHNSFRFVGCPAADHCNWELFGPYFGDAAFLLKIFSEDIEI
jgi:hypothetical protein